MSTTDSLEPRDGTVNRRDLVRLVAGLTTITAAGGLAGTALAQDPQRRRGRGRGRQQREPQPPPPHELAPSIQFQAAPGGTGAWLERLESTASEPLEVAPATADKPDRAEDLAFLPVHELAGLIRARKLSPVELTEVYLERLERLDEKLLAVVNLMKGSALEAAKAAQDEIAAGNYRGPLHGIPFGVKDLFSIKGVPTTWGAKPFEDRIIDADAEIVLRLRAAGAIPIAKLSLGTFARGDRWFRGRTRNPWNPEQGSSGSSAGSASATAAGCVGFGIGTETRGSIVSPARRCGLSALRPTFGRVTRHGGMTLSWSMDKVGPLCRTIEDCALVFDVIHGADPKDPTTVTAPFRFQREPNLGELRIGYTDGVDEAFLDKLRELGADPVKVGDRPSSRNLGNILGVESLAAFDALMADNLQEQMIDKDRIGGWERNRSVSAVEYLHGQRRRLKLMWEMAEFMKDLDLYVSASGDVGLTNYTGHPAVVVPYRFDGQPQCIQLVGNLFADDLVLSVAHAYQTATDWHTRRPALG